MRHSVSQINLKNGTQGLLINVPGSSVVSIVAAFNAGFAFADQNLPELPHLMEHLVVGANSRYQTMKDFEAAVEKNGAANNAFTSQYFLGYEMECAAFEFERILELLAVEISTPAFKPIEIGAEIGNVREELSRNLTEYSRVSYEALTAQTLGRRTVEESLASLDKITREDITAFYRRTHTTNNLRFILAGPVAKHRQLVRRLVEWTSAMKKGKRLNIPKEAPRHAAKPIIIRKDISQLYYRFTQYGPALPPQAEAALDVLGIILTDRYKSWILGEARDRGLAYTVDSGAMLEPAYTAFGVSAYTTPANSRELFRLIADKLKQAKGGDFGAAEIDEAKQLLTGRRLRQYKTPGHLLHWYSHGYFTYGWIDDFDRSLERIKRVSAKDLQAVIDQIFNTPLWGLSLVGDISDGEAKALHRILASIWE